METTTDSWVVCRCWSPNAPVNLIQAWSTGSERQATQVGGIPLKTSTVSPQLITGHWSAMNKRQIWNPPLVDERLGVCDRVMHRDYKTEQVREGESLCEWVSKSCCPHQNSSYWILTVDIHHSLLLCSLGRGGWLQNFNKTLTVNCTQTRAAGNTSAIPNWGTLAEALILLLTVIQPSRKQSISQSLKLLTHCTHKKIKIKALCDTE